MSVKVTIEGKAMRFCGLQLDTRMGGGLKASYMVAVEGDTGTTYVHIPFSPEQVAQLANAVKDIMSQKVATAQVLPTLAICKD